MKLHLPKLLLTAVVAAMGVQYAYAADDATYELTFGNDATTKSANVIQLATDYYLKTQDAGNATNYYVGLSTSGDPNSNRPSDAGVPVVTAREGGGWILTAPEEATNGKVYTWITRDASGASSANTAVPRQTTFAIGYDGTNSYVNVLNTSGNDAYVQMKGNQFDWSKMSLINDVGLTNVSLNIKTGILEY